MKSRSSVLAANPVKSITGKGSLKPFLFTLFILLVQFGQAQFTCTGLTTTNISYTGGVQSFTIPTGVSQVRISLTGASGGQASITSNDAGGGATVYAYVNVVPGDVFRVIIGQKGTNGAYEAGGGGSSAVYKNGVLIMVAGGGGGEDNTGNGGNGLASEDGGNGGSDAGTSSSGGCSTSANNGRGGTGGNGGNHGEFAAICVHGGGGGGGLNSPGQGNGSLNAGQPGGQGNINGAAGGAGSLDDAPAVYGGWGWSGGGGADDRESGGGGGYAGGGGGPESKNPGGGGSFVAAVGTNGITETGKNDGVGTTTGFDGSAIVCSSPAITLPVLLESFIVETTMEGVWIRWVSASEINADFYEIEVSTDGRHFSSAGTIEAANTGSLRQEYSWIDRTPRSSKTYYRLKMVDLDRKVAYSAVRMINHQSGHLLGVYPNPAKDRVTILLPDSWKAENATIIFFNVNGMTVLERKVTQLQNDFDISKLPVGLYHIKAFNKRDEQQLFVRLLKSE